MSKRRGRLGSKSDVLAGMTVTLSGKFSLPRRQFIRLIEDHGANVIINVTKRVTHIITTPEDARNRTIRIQQALKYSLPLLDEAFIHDCIEAGHKVNEEDYVINIGKGQNGKKVPLTRPTPVPSQERTPSPRKKTGRRSSRTPRPSSSSTGSMNDVPTPVSMVARSKRHLETGPEVEQPLKIMKRTPEVDAYARLPSYAKVLDDGFDNVYDVMLRLPFTDHDDFFLLQLIDASKYHMGQGKFVLYTRTGIVGQRGDVVSKTYKSKEKAIKEFEKKFYEMTLNSWNNRRGFSKARGKFEYVPFGYTKRLFTGEEYDSDEGNTTTEMEVDAEGDTGAASEENEETGVKNQDQEEKMISSEKENGSAVKNEGHTGSEPEEPNKPESISEDKQQGPTEPAEQEKEDEVKKEDQSREQASEIKDNPEIDTPMEVDKESTQQKQEAEPTDSLQEQEKSEKTNGDKNVPQGQESASASEGTSTAISEPTPISSEPVGQKEKQKEEESESKQSSTD